MRTTIGQKAHRVLRFLIGLRNPRIAGALAGYGFTAKHLQEGFARLEALVGTRLDALEAAKDPGVLRALDEFENTWFPVARVTLEAHYPEVAAVLFRNLTQQSGPAVMVSVNTFLKRIAQMESGEGGFGKAGVAARAVLCERGLTPDKVEQVQKLVDQLATLAVETPPQGPSIAEQQEAEERLWAWYLEWSGIARVAIKDGRHLRALGFVNQRKGADVIVTQITETPAAPAVLPATPEVPQLPSAATGH
ncbi:MAG TPA: hypothetical protein VHO25_02885 [Polyangiaceae bacterium]|nr:hypothetical protein [Polyangiaceae bacterium]